MQFKPLRTAAAYHQNEIAKWINSSVQKVPGHSLSRESEMYSVTFQARVFNH
jgi:hypothetical protein